MGPDSSRSRRVTHAVRFRSAKGAGIDDAVLAHERPLTMMLLSDAKKVTESIVKAM